MGDFAEKAPEESKLQTKEYAAMTHQKHHVCNLKRKFHGNGLSKVPEE